MKKVPYLNDYTLVDNIEFLSQCVLYVSVLISIGTLIISKGNFLIHRDGVIHLVNSLNCILAILYFFSDIITNYIFQDAESKRRDDFFDNSLNTKIAEENSQGYFSNDGHSPGIMKMGVNCFENSYLTKSVATKMLRLMVIKSIVVLVLFIVMAFLPDRDFLITAVQLALPFTIIQQTVRLFIFRNRIARVFRHFQQIFSSTTNGQKEQLIIHNVTSYETTLAWACIKLDSKLFNTMNPDLSLQWEDKKKSYNLA